MLFLKSIQFRGLAFILIIMTFICLACFDKISSDPRKQENGEKLVKKPKEPSIKTKPPKSSEKPDKDIDDQPPSNLQKIIQHIDKRFTDLDTIMSKDNKYFIKFPGSEKNHALGTGIAKNYWPSVEHKQMVDHIKDQISALKVKYPGRILFGMIGDYAFDKATGNCNRTKTNQEGPPGQQADGSFIIHVWGANAGNFNYPDGTKGSFGGGQADCFSHQRPGVFGISTMPGGDLKILLAKDKLLDLY